jgi:hypothetical protein
VEALKRVATAYALHAYGVTMVTCGEGRRASAEIDKIIDYKII